MLAELRKRFQLTTVDVDGVFVEITRTHGVGEPLFMLPVAQGTSETFYRQILAWGATRDVVSINYPAGKNAASQADFILRLIKSMGIEHFDILGTSYGAYLAQWITLASPAAVGRLVLGNGFWDPRPAQTLEKLQHLEDSTPEAIKAEVMGRLEKSPESELRSAMLDLIGQKQSPQAVRDRMLAVQRANSVPPLIFEGARLLLIDCDNDPLISPVMRESTRQRYPNAQHRTFAGGGHYPYILVPDAYNETVGNFLSL